MNAPESAQQRLARSRAQMLLWLDQDQSRREAFAHSGLGQLSALPWVQRIGNHPLASLALGALTRWWMKPREARSSTAGVLALGTGLSLLRRRPLLTVATVTGLGTLAWFQLRKRPTPPLK
ncbi:MAG: hypothetical protein DCF26_07145 [Burkholderiales bacterium]|nr:MAG: hypothetical protein DCF26_07145 [Burkholderiales bacterium]